MLQSYGNIDSSKDIVHFLHGNSLTPQSYDGLLREINKTINVNIFYFRPLWTKEREPTFINWDIFLDDYLLSIKDKKNIIGIGHSLGGNIILKAAMLYPEKFIKIILLDPTFFTPVTILAWKIINIFNLQKYFLPLVKSAERKKMSFATLDEMFIKYRSSQYFKNFNDATLKSFLLSLVKNNNNKLNLIYPKKWDARIYKKGLLNDFFIWRNFKEYNVQTLVIRAENSDVFLKKTENMVRSKNQNIKIKTIKNSDHMFPINNTYKTIDLINQFI